MERLARVRAPRSPLRLLGGEPGRATSLTVESSPMFGDHPDATPGQVDVQPSNRATFTAPTACARPAHGAPGDALPAGCDRHARARSQLDGSATTLRPACAAAPVAT